MNLSSEEFVNDLVDRRLVGATKAAKVTSLLDAWIRQEFTEPHSREVENLRRRSAGLEVELTALFDAVDDYIYSPSDNAYPDDHCNPEFLADLRTAFLCEAKEREQR